MLDMSLKGDKGELKPNRYSFVLNEEESIDNLLDVPGSICCILRCLSLLTHQLHRCLLETLQSLFLSSCQALLQFYMSLNKISIDIIYTHKKESTFIFQYFWWE